MQVQDSNQAFLVSPISFFIERKKRQNKVDKTVK